VYKGITSSSTPHPMEAIHQIPGNEVSVDHSRETCVSIVSMLKQHSECADGLFKHVPKVPIPCSITLTDCGMA
jgi:hypothetical protein